MATKGRKMTTKDEQPGGAGATPAGETWIDIGEIDRIPVQGAMVVRLPKGNIAVFRTADREAYAIADACPHRQAPLSRGTVKGKTVICPLHDWVINLESGRAQAGEEDGEYEGCVRTYSIRMQGGRMTLNVWPLHKR